MLNNQFLDGLPLWVIFLATVLLALLAIEAGYRLGQLRQWSPQESEASVGAMTGAALGMLAFILAFITGVGVSRFDTRRQLVLQEANAIGTANLRAGYLDEPSGSESHVLLREYVDMRLVALDPAQTTEAIARSEQIHNELWSRAEAVARDNPTSPTVAIYIEALNEVIDLHTERVIAAFTTHIPMALWFMIYAVALFTMMLVGIYSSLHGRQNRFATLLLVLVFAAVMFLMVDLDRSQEGFIQVNQQALIDLQRQLNAPSP